VPFSRKLSGLESQVRVLSGLARHLSQICTAKLSEVFAEDDLTVLEFGFVVILHEWPGIDQNTVAAKMAIDQTSVSAMVYKLEKRKLLKRGVDEEDRRARVLHLTKTGEKLLGRLRPQSRAAQQSLLLTLSPAERETFMDLLVRVVEANEAHARPGVGRRQPTARRV
jgi:DNA-binding MarR family transcriptional regulator